MILVELEGASNKWHHMHYIPLSTARILMIVVGVGIVVVMDTIYLKLYLKIIGMIGFRGSYYLCYQMVYFFDFP